MYLFWHINCNTKGTMKALVYIFVIGFLLLPLAAQNQQRMQADFKRLENYIERIEEQVTRFNDKQAMQDINRARQYLEDARSDLNQKPHPRYGSALQNMGQAKNFADRAARRIMQRPVGNLKRQLDDMIQDAEQVVVTSNNQEALYLLNQAKRFQNLAYQSYNTNRPVDAQEYYRISYFFAKKCTNLALNRNLDRDSRLRELEVTIQNLLIQAQSQAPKNETGAYQILLQEAQTYYQDALQLIDEGKEETALRRLILVERLLYRILDQSEVNNGDVGLQLAAHLYSQQTLLQSLESESIQKHENLLRKAQVLYDEAKTAYDQTNFKDAAQKLALSQRIANSLFRSLRHQESYADDLLPTRLNSTRQLLEMQNVSGNLKENRLYQEAHRLLDRAEEALARGNQAVAFQLIQAATRMSHRLQRISQQNEPLILDREKIEAKQGRLDEAINQYRNNRELNKTYGPIIDQWQFFADQGRKSLEQGNLLLAEEYINTGLEQIKEYSIKWHESSK
jgi:hypothetical protein